VGRMLAVAVACLITVACSFDVPFIFRNLSDSEVRLTYQLLDPLDRDSEWTRPAMFSGRTLPDRIPWRVLNDEEYELSTDRRWVTVVVPHDSSVRITSVGNYRGPSLRRAEWFPIRSLSFERDGFSVEFDLCEIQLAFENETWVHKHKRVYSVYPNRTDSQERLGATSNHALKLTVTPLACASVAPAA